MLHCHDLVTVVTYYTACCYRLPFSILHALAVTARTPLRLPLLPVPGLPTRSFATFTHTTAVRIPVVRLSFTHRTAHTTTRSTCAFHGISLYRLPFCYPDLHTAPLRGLPLHVTFSWIRSPAMTAVCFVVAYAACATFFLPYAGFTGSTYTYPRLPRCISFTVFCLPRSTRLRCVHFRGSVCAIYHHCLPLPTWIVYRSLLRSFGSAHIPAGWIVLLVYWLRIVRSLPHGFFTCLLPLRYVAFLVRYHAFHVACGCCSVCRFVLLHRARLATASRALQFCASLPRSVYDVTVYCGSIRLLIVCPPLDRFYLLRYRHYVHLCAALPR